VHRRYALALALAIIVGPLLCGAIFFVTRGPVQKPGAYVETADGVYPLPTCLAGTSPDVSAAAAVALGEVRAFFLVLPDRAPARASADGAQLSLRVVNHAEPQIDYGRAPLPTTIRRMNANVYRVSSDQTLRWDPRGPTDAIYRRALARMPGNRATTEVLLVLEVPQPHAGSCLYAMTLGPPPSLPDADVKWFVPPATKHP
jgi:hypothetical protein